MTRGWAGRIGLALASGLLLVLCSLHLPTWLDALWPWPPPPAGSPAGRVALGFAWVTSPVVPTVAVLLVAWWVARRRLRRLAAELLISTLASLSMVTVLKGVVGRFRPDSPWEFALSHTASFPSGHAAGASMLVLCLVSVSNGLRWPRGRRLLWGAGWSVFAFLVFTDRLFLGVHHVSDIVGGILDSVFAHSVAAALTYYPQHPRSAAGRSVALVLNPSKVRDTALLDRIVNDLAGRRGWQIADTFTTTPEDPGTSQTQAALESGADLVLVAGGDGTQRAACAALAHTRATLGVLPHGAGDLFARALGVPCDLVGALCAALDGNPRGIDVLRLQLDGRDELAITMAGAGADARVLTDTSAKLKRRVGPLAYVLAGAHHVAARPTDCRVTVDAEVVFVGASSQVEVGNVADLRPGIALLPGASAFDGRLDVLVASPRTAFDVLRMIAGVLAGSRHDRQLTRSSGAGVKIEFAEVVPCQADGEIVGNVATLTAEVDGSAISVALP